MARPTCSQQQLRLRERHRSSDNRFAPNSAGMLASSVRNDIFILFMGGVLYFDTESSNFPATRSRPLQAASAGQRSAHNEVTVIHMALGTLGRTTRRRRGLVVAHRGSFCALSFSGDGERTLERCSSDGLGGRRDV